MHKNYLRIYCNGERVRTTGSEAHTREEILKGFCINKKEKGIDLKFLLRHIPSRLKKLKEQYYIFEVELVHVHGGQKYTTKYWMSPIILTDLMVYKYIDLRDFSNQNGSKKQEVCSSLHFMIDSLISGESAYSRCLHCPWNETRCLTDDWNEDDLQVINIMSFIRHDDRLRCDELLFDIYRLNRDKLVNMIVEMKVMGHQVTITPISFYRHYDLMTLTTHGLMDESV